MKTKLDAIVMVRENYGEHPCGTRFCRCGWIMCPPAYPGDYWDCTNGDCGKSKSPSQSDIRKMTIPVKRR